MKGLLHSKRFKENLYRWLFMYVGVIGLLTTVITYSKYMTQLVPNGDTAKTAIFEADIKYTDASGNVCAAGTSCTTGVYRPTSEIKYYFILETNFEVLADIYLTTRIKDDDYSKQFKIISIKKVVSPTEKTTIVDDKTTGFDGMLYTAHFQNEMDVDNRPKPSKELYEVTVQYKGTFDSTTEFSTEAKPVIEVGYTAEQRNS